MHPNRPGRALLTRYYLILLITLSPTFSLVTVQTGQRAHMNYPTTSSPDFFDEWWEDERGTELEDDADDLDLAFEEERDEY